MARLRRAIQALVVSALLLGAAEGALRLTYAPEDLLFVAEEGHPPLPPPRPVDGSSARNGIQRTDGPYTWTVRLNRQGLRETEDLTSTAPAGTTRLLAVGDSWIFGFGATDGHTLVDQLELLLTGSLAPRVDVLNGGQPGASAMALQDRARGMVRGIEGLAGLILGQPHNPTRGRGPTSSPAPPDVWLYRYLRHAILPRVADHPPRSLDGTELEAALAAYRSLVDDARAGRLTADGRPLPVWFVAFPQDRESAVEHGFAPESEWLAAMEGVPVVGHALSQRSCWAYTDPFHPGEAGQRAIAEVLAPVIAGAPAQPPWSREPSCDDVPGIGPGKPGAP